MKPPFKPGQWVARFDEGQTAVEVKVIRNTFAS